MEVGATMRNVSGDYETVNSDVDDMDDMSLAAIDGVDHGSNLTVNRELLEDLLRQMEYESNFDPFTQVNTTVDVHEDFWKQNLTAK